MRRRERERERERGGREGMECDAAKHNLYVHMGNLDINLTRHIYIIHKYIHA